MQLTFAISATLFFSSVIVSELYSSELAVATPVDSLSESFDVAPKTSGLPLVGLRLVSTMPAPSLAKLDVSNIAIALPSVPVRQICVRVTTQDARFMALNPYRISAVQAGTTSARLDPVSVRYRQHLERYSSSEFAVKAYVSNRETCSPVAALHLPEIDKPTTLESGALALKVNVNSRGRDTYATLGKLPPESTQARPSEALQVKVNCEKARALAGLAFDTICTIPIDNYESSTGKLWTLKIVMNDGFDDSTSIYSVYLP